MKRALVGICMVLLFNGFVQGVSVQEKVQPFPIVTSTWDGPFKIIRSVSHLEIINTEQGILGLSTDDAILSAYNKGWAAVEAFAKKNDANAVINTSTQVLLIPGKGTIGVIFFNGTLIKSLNSARP